MSDSTVTGQLRARAGAGVVETEWASVRPYVLPIVVFGLLTALETPLSDYYLFIYAAKVVAVTAALLVWREPLQDIRPSRLVIGPSVLVGLILFVVWVGLGNLVPYSYLGARSGFDPFTLDSGLEVGLFLAMRFYGLVLLVPVMEELFWRSFLLRYLTSSAFRSVRIGAFSTSALLIMIAASAIAHPEWLAAALTSLALALWLRRTGSLFAVVVAHAATNAALGIYVLATGSWQYW